MVSRAVVSGRARAAVALTVGILVALLSSTPADATLPGRNGRIALVGEDCSDTCYDNVGTVTPSGRGFEDFGPDEDALLAVAFSPGGGQLAFDYGGDIRVSSYARIRRRGLIGGLGSFLTRSRDADWDTSPRWSRKGGYLIFERDIGYAEANSRAAIYRVERRTRTLRRITPRLPGGSLGGLSPDLSSRNEIVFRQGGLVAMDSSGGGVHRVTDGGQDMSPSWSPDGQMIAFVRYAGASATCAEGIFLVRRDGTGLRRLASGCAHAPAWSPDGRQVAFLRRANETSFDQSLEIVTVAGDLIRRNKHFSNKFHSLAWQPLPG